MGHAGIVTSMPALTLWQPWASLVTAGCKNFEFRKWPAPAVFHHRRIAIHAGTRAIVRDEVRHLVLQLNSADWRQTGLNREASLVLLEPMLVSLGVLPRGAVLCLATLGTPIKGAVLSASLGLTNDSDRDEHTNWGWPLTNVERLEPYVPARGAQGFWTWNRSEP